MHWSLRGLFKSSSPRKLYSQRWVRKGRAWCQCTELVVQAAIPMVISNGAITGIRDKRVGAEQGALLSLPRLFLFSLFHSLNIPYKKIKKNYRYFKN